jgi:sugar lactone lactonase YvrE
MSLHKFLTLGFAALLHLNVFGQSTTVTTYVGPVLPVSGYPAITQTVGVPQGVAPDGIGGFYLSSSTHNQVYRVSAEGILTVVAGNGTAGYSGDGGPAIDAQFHYIHALAVDASGNIFVADTNNNRVRKINPAGIVTTIAGTGAWGSEGEGGAAASAQLAGPRGVAVDGAGNLFIADSGNNRIRRVSLSGIITTTAGNENGGYSGDGGPATSARLNYPTAIAVDMQGNLFIADRYNNRIRFVSSMGIITTLAAPPSISDPRGVAVDFAGNVYVADSGNNRIRQISSGGISTIAGGSAGFSGDGGPAHDAKLSLPIEIAADALGNLFIADRGNYRIRKIDGTGIITTAAGRSDEGGAATSAQLNFPNAVAADQSGNLFIADTDSQRIRKVTPSGVVTTVAGNGAVGFAGDGGPAAYALLSYPAGVTVDDAGNLFIADTRNNRIRKVTSSGMISTLAGAGLNDPHGVAVDSSGNVFVADTNNQRIRKIDSAGVISTVAGNGTSGFSGDGGPATAAQLSFPVDVAVDENGNVFIADSSNHRVRLIRPDGIIHTIAGNGTEGYGGDGGPAISAALASPQGVDVDEAGNVYIADAQNQRVRIVTTEGIIRTLVGTGAFGYAGDGGAAESAQLALPLGVAADGFNTLFIADTYSSRVRRSISSKVPFALSSGGAVSMNATTSSVAAVRTGYARVQSAADAPAAAAFAILSNRSDSVLISETGVPAAAPLTAGRIYAEVNGPLNTGVAIANPTGQAVTVNFVFTDTEGNDVGSGGLVVDAKQQISKFLDSDVLKAFPGSSFQGTFSFTSEVPVGVIAIRGFWNERQEFLMSTLPVVDRNAPSTTGAVTIPHFVNGASWLTQILLVNPADTSLSGRLEFRNDGGTPTNVTIDDQTDSVFAYVVAPKSSRTIVAAASDSLITGSVRVVPVEGPAPVAHVVFSYRSGGVTVSETGVPAIGATALRVYVESAGNVQSGVAVANNSDAPASVTLELSNSDGSRAGLPGPVVRDLPPFGRFAQFVAEIFPSLPAGFKGVLRVSTSSPSGVSVVGVRGHYNERGDFLMPTTAPINEAEVAATHELILPHFVDGAGFSTEFIILNGTSTSLPSGELMLYQDSGQPFPLSLR